MVGIQGISGIPEPKPERPAKIRETKDQSTAVGKSGPDGVVISSEAQAAARVAQLIQSTGQSSEVRMERVEAARERIDRGDYKNPEVVAKVAEKISKYLP